LNIHFKAWIPETAVDTKSNKDDKQQIKKICAANRWKQSTASNELRNFKDNSDKIKIRKIRIRIICEVCERYNLQKFSLIYIFMIIFGTN
jgi:hypothetical protein